MTSRRDVGLEGLSNAPVVVLSALHATRQYDLYAYAVLAPEIRTALGTNVVGVLVVLLLMTAVTVLVGVGSGYRADRASRPALAAVGAGLAALAALLSGLAVNLFQLVTWRILSAAAHGVHNPAQHALLSDTYPPALRARVFTWHQAAATVATYTSPALIGGLGYLLGWRAPFLVLALAAAGLAIAARRLPQAKRGAHERRALGADDEAAEREQTPAGFSEATRTVFAIKSLRRAAIGLQVMASALVGLVVLASLFFTYVYRLDPVARGLILVLTQPFALAALWFAVPRVERLLQDAPDRAVRLMALAAAVAAGAAGVTALVPFLAFAVLGLIIQVSAAAVIIPGLNALFSMLMPPRLRGFGFGYVAFWMLPGLGNLPGIGAVGDHFGMRWALLMLAPLYGIGAAIVASAAGLVGADVERAAVQSMTEHEVRIALGQGREKLLLVRDLDVAYDDIQVLFGLDLEIFPGEVLALLGTNGAGKSTLLKAITGLVDPSGGVVYFDGLDITHLGPIETFRLGVVQMPGGRSVFPTVSVAEHLDLAAGALGFSASESRQATERVLDWLPALRARLDQAAGNLSGGEQQMLGLAVALMARPKLLLVDELSLGLAPAIVAQLLDVIRRINADGVTVVIVEQSLTTALAVADRAYFLEKGSVRFCGPTRELLERGDIARAVFLPTTAASVAGGSRSRAQNGGAGPKRTTRSSVSAGASEAPPVLEVRDLVRSFGGITAVNGVSLDVYPNEIVGLIGPNGAGKTTIFDLVSGFLLPDQGTVCLHGTDITTWAPDRRAREGLGRSFQDARIFPSLTVEENVAVSLERHLWVRDHVADFVRLPDVEAQERDVRFTTDRLIGLMGLDGYRDMFVSELSTGTRRVVDLAMAIAHHPSLLILDEPSSGIAQRETEALGPLLRRIRRQLGCAILLIEHDMGLISAVSDRILALELGRVIAEGTAAEVLSDPRVVASYLGEVPASPTKPPPRRRRPATSSRVQANGSSRRPTKARS